MESLKDVGESYAVLMDGILNLVEINLRVLCFKTGQGIAHFGKLLVMTCQIDNLYVRLNVKSKGCVNDILS